VAQFFSAGATRSPHYVTIGIYNLNGQLVNQLISGTMPSGPHKLNWNGDTKVGRLLENGIYLVVLKTNEQVITKKVSLLK
jgi:flagellar hook assembly protein FlgD